MQKEIQKINQTLVDENVEYTIIHYVKYLNELFFNININFIDDFMDFVTNEGFVIHHDMIFKYGILNNSDTNHINRLLKQYDFEEDVDYSSCLPPDSWGRIIYMLKPEIFKMLLIRSI